MQSTTWGLGKNRYRGLHIRDKRGKEQFRANVSVCLGRDYVTLLERVRKFSRRARRYMVAYYLLGTKGNEVFNDDEEMAKLNDTGNRATPIKIEKLVKLQKAHRCAFDFDRGFIRHMEDGVDTTYIG
jgi:hypothetical protein